MFRTFLLVSTLTFGLLLIMDWGGALSGFLKLLWHTLTIGIIMGLWYYYGEASQICLSDAWDRSIEFALTVSGGNMSIYPLPSPCYRLLLSLSLSLSPSSSPSNTNVSKWQPCKREWETKINLLYWLAMLLNPLMVWRREVHILYFLRIRGYLFPWHTVWKSSSQNAVLLWYNVTYWPFCDTEICTKICTWFWNIYMYIY